MTKTLSAESNNSMKRPVISRLILPVALLGAIGLFGITWAQNVSRQKAGTTTLSSAASNGPVLSSTNEAPKPRPLSFYTSGIRSDLFTVNEAAAIAMPKKKEAAKPVVQIADIQPVPPPNPLADYVYTGTVTANGQRYALLENSKTREGHFLAVGDSLLGGTVGDITDRGLTVNIAGAPQMMAKTDNYKLTPFDKSAPYLQGGDGGANGGPNGGGTPSFGAPSQMAGAMQPGQGMRGMRGMQGRFGGMGGGPTMQMKMGGQNGGPVIMDGQNAVMKIQSMDGGGGAFVLDTFTTAVPAAPTAAPTTYEVVK